MDGLWVDFLAILNQWNSYLEGLELSKKERYKWISLKIEEDSKLNNDGNIDEKIDKLILGINRELYKKLSWEYKIKMNTGDMDAFTQYTNLINTAKKMGIK